MKKIIDFFKQRWFISLLGIIALGLFIWFIGPLFAFADYAPLEDEANRWYLMGLAFFLWIAVRGWAYFKAKKQNSQVMSAMAGSDSGLTADELSSQEEVDALQQRMSEALGVLKESRLGSGPDRQFLYQLPWYIIIGPPGAGKTTLLKNSDLKFPLSDRFGKDAVRGVGGTRNCDWWFTDDAVLLDTAGRYTTQDSHEPVDQAAWSGFLDLLKKNRSRRPINGVIIAVSLSDLLEHNGDKNLSQARSIRTRLQELQERLNIRFPVYLLFTKCDLLAGFMEYFDDLDKEGRSQVWGMTFKLDEVEKQKSVEQFKLEFGLLKQQLQNQLLDKLERERGQDRREHIYTFPQQFSAMDELIVPFLEELFQSSRYAHEAMYRGVYFTSGTQEGSPIDRIMGTLSSNYGLSQQSQLNTGGQGKSFFINSLLKKVVFLESGLAGTNLKLEKKRRWFQQGAFVGVAALTALMMSAWVMSYFGNKSYIEEVSAQTAAIDEKINQIDPNESEPLSLLPLLDEVRNMPGGYAEQEAGTPWRLGFGLYQGDKLGDASVQLYRKLLKQAMLPRLMSRIEGQLQQNADNTDYLYEALKVYLMLANSDNFDANAIAAWYNLDWKYNLPLEVITEQRNSLNQHLTALLEQQVTPLPRPVNTTLVKQTQDLLQNTPLAERVYSGLKQALKENEVADYRVSDKAGRDALLVLISKSGQPLTTGVPGLFTCAGYKDVFLKNKDRLILQHASSSWIFGTQQDTRLSHQDIKTLEEDVLALYLQDYIIHWDALLEDIQVKPFSTDAQMVEVLNIISGEHSPLKSFLVSVDVETSMSCLQEEGQSMLEKAGEKLNSARSSLDRIMRTTPENQAVAVPSRVSTNKVIKYFKGLHEMVNTKDGIPPPIDRTLAILEELHIHTDSIVNASGDAMKLELIQQSLPVINKVKLEGKRTPFPVSNIVEKIAVSSNAIVTGGTVKHLNESWRSDVLPFCNKAIQGLYPVGKKSRDITFEDFTYFFAPGGLMDEFFNSYLDSSVEKRGNWRWSSRGKGGRGVSSAALKQFQRADNIKKIFFRMGKQSPTVSFKLKPISMSPSISQFIIDIDGQKLTYAHGPLKPVAMKWPGPNDSGQVRIQLLPTLQGKSGLSKEGPWALFRLFDQADITRTSNPAVFIMTFSIQGREAKFELRANSAVNPFQLTDLQKFRCPQTL